MPVTYSVDRERNLVLETWTGMVTAPEVATAWRAMAADAEVNACRRLLCDVREASTDLTSTDFAELVYGLLAPALGTTPFHTAIVVGTPFQYGKARQFEAFAQTIKTIQICHDEQSAVAWLEAQSSAAVVRPAGP